MSAVDTHNGTDYLNLIRDIHDSPNLSDRCKSIRRGWVLSHMLMGREFSNQRKAGMVLDPSEDFFLRHYGDRELVFKLIRRIFREAGYLIKIPTSWQVKGVTLLAEFPWTTNMTLTNKQMTWVKDQGWSVQYILTRN